jgi:hypothetical protein
MMSITISGFSPILAYLMSLLGGKRGLAGWSWIFVRTFYALAWLPF